MNLPRKASRNRTEGPVFDVFFKKRPENGDLDWRRPKGSSGLNRLNIKFLEFPEGTWHIMYH